MENKNKRQFLGIWIPRSIYLNKNLSWTDKILLIEIESLDNERGCFASNDYFAEFLGVTKTTISTSISKLKKLGYVEQVSFDGRTRILKADFKENETQTLKKFKGRQTENLKHNNTINKTINKNQKIIKKDLEIENKKLSDDPKLNRKVNEMLNGSLCIDVKELKNEQLWLDHCSRYLQLKPYFTNQLLQQFIDEQVLKDDAFKSVKETKSHFLNWAKIEVAKNRKFGNDQWGKFVPQHYVAPKQQKQEQQTPQISDEEKKRLHVKFINDNLLKPYKTFCETGQLRITNFGGIVYKELQKFDLLVKDKKQLDQIKKQLTEKKEKHTKRGRIAKSFMDQMGKTNNSTFEIEHIKISLEKLKEQKTDIKQIIL